MPTSRRDGLKRKHTAIENALDRCLGWTVELHDLFKEPHPDYAKGYEQIGVMLMQAKEFVAKMKTFI